MEQAPPEVREAGELVHEASVDEIGDDEEKDETREEMRPRHRSTITQDAERNGGDREEGGDQRLGLSCCGDVAASPHGSRLDRKSTRLNSSHLGISYAVFC